MIRALETDYRGIRFRSRLEARWAVFLDTLGVRYHYERQGYELLFDWPGQRGKVWYLPDFWLPDYGLHMEVKGCVTEHDVKTLSWAACPHIHGFPRRNKPCLTERTSAHHFGDACIDLLCVGDIPEDTELTPAHSALYFHKGHVCRTWFTFGLGLWDKIKEASCGNLYGQACVNCQNSKDPRERRYKCKKNPQQKHLYRSDWPADSVWSDNGESWGVFPELNASLYLESTNATSYMPEQMSNLRVHSTALRKAYSSARSARF